MRLAQMGAIALAIGILGGGACGGGEEAAPADTAAPAADTTANIDAATAITVTLTGGPHAGTYTTYSDQPLCAVGTNEENLWSAQLADDTVTAGLGAVQVMIPDTTAARAGTGVFHFSAIVGSMMQGTDYTIESRPRTRAVGRGTATVNDTGTGATITIEGVTRDTVQLRAEIRCREVRRGR
ncbi:MAG TPA: hypothetical protein VK922_13145 [Gemmatimonadaceae bacterium]|nr:hypothetical protein [Gemmatimonadaceae bacterium]